MVNNSVLMVGPLDTLRALFALAGTEIFWLSILSSLMRVFSGFFLALALGLLFASLALFKPFYMLVLPMFNVIKSIPVASFVIIAIIWVGSANLVVFIAFITVWPIIFFNAYEGLKATDKDLLEMADFFNVSFFKKVRYIYYRELLPHMVSAINTGFGFAWKSGIAAELIGITRDSIGFHLHTARVFLQTADLFAWTFTIVILSYSIEKIFFWIFKERN